MISDATWRRASTIFLALLATAIVWQFHDQNWWPPDDGAYAHIAERLLRGEVLNGSIYDIHLGLVHFVNAAAFKLFGATMVALRYPLALFTVLQCVIVMWLLKDQEWLTALAGGIAMATLTFVQFLNPTANWYALFATIVLISAVIGIPRDAVPRYYVLGALVMTVIMFRQLTGAIVAIGLVTYLLAEGKHRGSYAKPRLAQAVLVLCALALAFYLFKNASPLSILLFGIWPLGLIVLAVRNCVISDRTTVRLIGEMALGAGLAIAPLVGYHLVNGSLVGWIDDTVLSAFRLVSLPFFDRASYVHLPMVAVMQLAGGLKWLAILNGFFWIALLVAPPMLGWIALRRSLGLGERVPPLAHMAVFFALVSVHYEIPIYLFYTTALTLCGLLSVSGEWSKRAQLMAGATVLLIAGVGLWSHAGQPLTRGMGGIAAGERMAVDNDAINFRVGLRVAPAEKAFYEWLVPLIRKNR